MILELKDNPEYIDIRNIVRFIAQNKPGHLSHKESIKRAVKQIKGPLSLKLAIVP